MIEYLFKWLCVQIPLLSVKLQTWCQLQPRSFLTFRQTNPLNLLRLPCYSKCFKPNFVYNYIPTILYPMPFYNHFHNTLKILMFCQDFFSLQVKQSAIIFYKYAIYDLPNDLPNDFRFRVLENSKMSGKSQNVIEWYPSAQYSLRKGRFC